MAMSEFRSGARIRLMTMTTAAALFLVVAFGREAWGQTQIVKNGTFDTPVPNNMSGGDWTSSGINISGGYSMSGGNPGGYFWLNSDGFTSPGPSLTQALSLSPGQLYVLSGDYRSGTHDADPATATNSFHVDLNGNPVFFSGPTAFAPWLHFNLCFPAPSAVTTLTLTGEANNSDNDFYVDNISVVPHAETVVNGTFENMVAHNGTGVGWTSSGLDGSGGWAMAGGNPGGYLWLNAGGHTSPGPTISQVLSLVPGQAYDLKGDYRSGTHNADPATATNSFHVDLNGSPVFSSGPTSFSSWSHFNVCVKAASTANTLTLTGEANNSDNDFYVDNVSVVPRCAPCGANLVGANKDFQNNTGAAVNDIEWLLEGKQQIVNHYDGPYPGEANSTFSSFSVVPSGPNTLLRWAAGASIANGGFAHVGFQAQGGSLRTLGASWTIDGAFAGCARQVSIGRGHSHLSGGIVAFENSATNCESASLYVGNIRLEWFGDEVALADLMSSGVRVPLRTDVVSAGPTLLSPGVEAAISIPLPPLGAQFAMVQYTVSASPTLAGPGNTVDYVELPLELATSVPALSGFDFVFCASLVVCAGILLLGRRSQPVRPTG